MRALRRAAFAVASVLALLAVACAIATFAIERLSRIAPPPREPSRERPLEASGERTSVGPSWLSRERGVWEAHLEGDPYALGFAHARLGERLLLETEEYMFGELRRYVPSAAARFLIRLGVGWKYRHLGGAIPPDRLRELGAMAYAFPAGDPHADFLPAFQRILDYHALHDITQRLEHSPLLGCTAFAAAGPATRDGHLYVGRNFDFEGPEPFDRDKAILFFRPDGKIPFASVAWLGMAGVVTGINAEKLYVSINAARTDDKTDAVGIPVALLVREVLENARSIDEAIAIVRAHPVMVPDFYLVADGKTGESAVIERSPTRLAVRRSRDVTLLANHALTPAFAGDREDERLKRDLTSGARFARLDELVRARHGSLDPTGVLAILRDKRGVGGQPIALGNRNALDALIATHSVVVDATDLIVWVAAGPHLLGRYVGFDLRKELLGEPRPDPPDLPPDPIAQSELLARHEQAVRELHAAQELAKRAPEAAIERARVAASLDDLLPEAHRLLGDLLRTRAPSQARAEYERFLSLDPPYRKDAEAVTERLRAPP